MMTARTPIKEVYVYAHWKELEVPRLMGTLNIEIARGKEIFSFEYNAQWLQSGNSQFLDPDLGLYSGAQYLRDKKVNFGLFLDSSPDRWGRILMKRREASLARKEGREIKTLRESDYLLGVYDQHRMGALRFKTEVGGEYLSGNKAYSAPPWTSLRNLEYACLQLEQEDATENPEYISWLNMLIAPGSSLGGARPKASVVDVNGELWIAKFPSLKDQKDVGVWEMITNQLARNSGLEVAKAKVRKFNSHHHTYLTRRFDRTIHKGRIHFASAMTLLGYSDGTGSEEGVSYLEIAEFIMQQGARVNRDLEEMWRRIIFSICVANTDDHLRNHGFLLTESGWILSPAYDINPVEYGTGLSLNISEEDNALDLELAVRMADFFRLKTGRVKEIIDQVQYSVSQWKTVANEFGVSKLEQDMMSKAFSKAFDR